MLSTNIKAFIPNAVSRMGIFLPDMFFSSLVNICSAAPLTNDRITLDRLLWGDKHGRYAYYSIIINPVDGKNSYVSIGTMLIYNSTQR